MKNCKTTLLGALIAICVAIEPIISTGSVSWKAVGMGALIALIGYVAKDGETTPPTAK